MPEVKVLRLEDQSAVIEFENRRLAEQISDPMERELASWHARWRPESLEHYLPLGWSFGIWSGNQLEGYFLAQPFLFFRGMTQTLWVEHLAFNAESVAHDLVEVAYRMSREKHFQKVMFADGSELAFALEKWKAEPVKDPLREIKTAKF